MTSRARWIKTISYWYLMHPTTIKKFWRTSRVDVKANLFQLKKVLSAGEKDDWIEGKNLSRGPRCLHACYIRRDLKWNTCITGRSISKTFKVFFLSFDFRFCLIEWDKISQDFVHTGVFLFWPFDSTCAWTCLAREFTFSFWTFLFWFRVWEVKADFEPLKFLFGFCNQRCFVLHWFACCTFYSRSEGTQTYQSAVELLMRCYCSTC